MKLFGLLSAFLLLSHISWGHLIPPDSIGIRKINNQHFIVHKVERGETLTSISNRYHVALATLRQSNINLVVLKAGQIILVPFQAAKPEKVARATMSYRVRQGDHLYKIARQFSMDLARLKTINQLTDNALTPGQTLKVEVPANSLGEPITSVETAEKIKSGQALPDSPTVPITHQVMSGETMYGISNQYQVSIDSINQWNNLAERTPLHVGQKLIVGYRKMGSPPRKNTLEDIPEDAIPHNTSESGVGAMIRDRGQSSLVDVCLHSTAKYGTLIKVTNPSNNRSIAVKVIGKLSDVDKKNQVIARISEAACEKIGILNDQFPILLEYNK